MRTELLVLGALLTVACSDSTGSTPPPEPSLAGAWKMTLAYAGSGNDGSADYHFSCTGATTATFEDKDGALTGSVAPGSGTCDVDGTTFDVEWDLALTGDRVKDAVTLVSGSCTFTGKLAKASLSNGVIACGDGTFSANGTWGLKK